MQYEHGLGISVPMDVPVGFESHLQYREYLSWRIEIQMLVDWISKFQKANSKEDQKACLAKIKEMAKRINRRANTFPPQILPTDLKVTHYSANGSDSPAPDATQQGEMECFSAKKLMQCILNLTGSAITLNAVTAKEIEDTTSFSDALEQALGVDG